MEDVPLPLPPLAPAGWLGPLARFDLVRLARRKRSFLLRFLYGLALLFVTWLYPCWPAS